MQHIRLVVSAISIGTVRRNMLTAHRVSNNKNGWVSVTQDKFQISPKQKCVQQWIRRPALFTTSPHPILFCLLLLRVVSANGTKLSAQGDNQIEQRFAMEPQDQTAIVGSHVTLPCRVVNKSGLLQWTKDDFGMGTHRNLSGFERYSMIGSDDEGDFSLDISPVMLDDDAKYQCQVGPGTKGTPGIRSRFATLIVLVPPEAPKIVQGNYLVTTEDREIELECVSVGGKPAAEITWIDGLGNVLSKGIEYMKEPLRDTRRYTAKSILKLIPKMEHHNTTFSCQAQNTADRNYRSVGLKLEVKYAPKVHIGVIEGVLSGGRIIEGTDVRLACYADANPQDLVYSWFIDDELFDGIHAQVLHIGNVSRQHHETVVRCEVRNAVGKSENSETLNITYGPSFRVRPMSIEADQETEVTLSCDVDGNPPPDVLWVHEAANQVVSSTPNLTITVTHGTAGRYYCKARVPGFSEVKAAATVHLRGPPVISSPRQQFGIMHESAQLECLIRSIPRHLHVIWSFNGRELNATGLAGDTMYLAHKTSTPNGVRATLIVNHCQREHFGYYNCTVVNDYGSDYLEIEFTSKDQYLLPVIVLGSLGGITFSIIVIVIGICLCSRRNEKKHLPPADVIPKYDVPGQTYDARSVSVQNHNSIFDRDIDKLDNEQHREVARKVRPLDSSVVLATADLISSPLAMLEGCIVVDRYSGDFSESLSHLQQQQQEKTLSPTNTVAINIGYEPYVSYTYSQPRKNLMHSKASNSINSNESGNTVAAKQATVQTANSHLLSGTMTLNRLRNNGSELAPINDNALSSIPGSKHPEQLMSHPMIGCHIGLDRFGVNYEALHIREDNSPMGPLPLQPALPPPATANPAVTPAPPPYNVARAYASVLRLGLHPSTGTTSCTSNSGVITSPISNSSSPSSAQSGSLSLASSHLSQGPSMVSEVATVENKKQQQHPQQQMQPQQSNNTSGQFILPSSGTVKPGLLATHV